MMNSFYFFRILVLVCGTRFVNITLMDFTELVKSRKALKMMDNAVFTLMISNSNLE